VHARFGLEPAEGVLARDLDRRRFDAGLFARALFQPFDLAVMALCPAVVSVCICAISLAQRDAMRRTNDSLALPAWPSRL